MFNTHQPGFYLNFTLQYTKRIINSRQKSAILIFGVLYQYISYDNPEQSHLHGRACGARITANSGNIQYKKHKKGQPERASL
jgi:hypothetical protein